MTTNKDYPSDMIGCVQEEFARLVIGLDDAVPFSLLPSHKVITDLLIAVANVIRDMDTLREVLDNESKD